MTPVAKTEVPNHNTVVLLHLQEPHLPPASSSSYLESSTSASFLKNRRHCCPDPRFRYSFVPSAIKEYYEFNFLSTFQSHLNVLWIQMSIFPPFHSRRPPALLPWESSSWSWVCRLSLLIGWQGSLGVEAGTSSCDWTEIQWRIPTRSLNYPSAAHPKSNRKVWLHKTKDMWRTFGQNNGKNKACWHDNGVDKVKQCALTDWNLCSSSCCLEACVEIHKIPKRRTAWLKWKSHFRSME